jgi:rhodanese-related sulfurtransferase
MHLNKLAHKINSEGLKFGVIRWFTELTGVPNLKYSRIVRGLYVGGKLSTIGILFLRLNRFKSILNLRSEFDDENLGIEGFNYFYIRCEEFQPIMKGDLQTGVEFINQELKNSRKIYIHCAEGVSRAPSFAAAYFISQGLSLESALSSIKGKRPFINILDGQINSLREFEKSYKRNKF